MLFVADDANMDEIKSQYRDGLLIIRVPRMDNAHNWKSVPVESIRTPLSEKLAHMVGMS